MEFCLETLGCTIPATIMYRRRQALEKRGTQQHHRRQPCKRSFRHRDSLRVYLDRQKQQQQEKEQEQQHSTTKLRDDDDTASTQSTTSTSLEEEDDFFVTSAASHKRVSFCKPLVTSVHTRALTKPQDKYYLHYSEHDYVDFKVEYLTGKSRNRKVSFQREVVTEVNTFPPTKCPNLLYYSEDELQGFLDEFVHSLNQRS